MEIKIKKLDAKAKMPVRATEGSAGFDLFALSDAAVNEFCVTVVPTGLAFEIPAGYEVQIRPRSGMAAKFGVTVINTPGTIDSDYRGEVKVAMIKLSHWGMAEGLIIRAGDRIAQMVVNKLPEVDLVEVTDNAALSDTTRGAGGFGSTGG